MSGPSDPLDPPEDDDLLAAEYVLGVLDASARRAFERRMNLEAALERRVQDWQHRLSPMLDTIEPVEAPPAAWQAITADLDRMGRQSAPRPSAATAPRDDLVSRAWKWFGLGSFGLLAAGVMALFVLTQGRVAPPPLAAVIASADGPALYAAVIDRRRSRATLIPIAVAADPGHSHELWMIAPNEEPRSLGLLNSQAPIEVVLTPDLLSGATALAISLEPPGGSPTGLPTGPVVGTGELRGV